MVMIIMPKIYTEIKDDVHKAIHDVIANHNIAWKFALDSESLKDAIDMIAMVLTRLKTDVKPELDKETLKHFQELKKAVKEEIK